MTEMNNGFVGESLKTSTGSFTRALVELEFSYGDYSVRCEINEPMPSEAMEVVFAVWERAMKELIIR